MRLQHTHYGHLQNPRPIITLHAVKAGRHCSLVANLEAITATCPWFESGTKGEVPWDATSVFVDGGLRRIDTMRKVLSVCTYNWMKVDK